MLKTLPFLRKSRKYPIRRDEYGRSLRKQSFDYFDKGKMPSKVSYLVDASIRTIRRYYADWKKLPVNLDIQYRMLKKMIKDDPELLWDYINSEADKRGMAREEALLRLQTPHGLKQLLMGKWPNYREQELRKQHESRLHSATKFVELLELYGMSSEETGEAINTLIEKAQNAVGRNRASD